ncbi:DUF4998 domain-containing protein [Niabella insulamsoli]|uniref:DUF4998 domain-containing protein n=1 Tax=Niabella insulamsoli TaxID=3144874 RepID=UPI0031FCDBA4
MNTKYIYCLCFIALVLFASCRKWDEFKKFVSEGERIYTGKLDSVKIYSGKNRVRLTGMIKSDPKVKYMKVTWRDDMDSAIFNIRRTESASIYIDTIINVSDEGIMNFKIRTYDEDNNPSVAVNAVGTSYGAIYRSKLTARNILSKSFAANQTTITWQTMDPFLGPEYTEILYAQNGEAAVLQTPVSAPKSVLVGFDIRNEGFEYRTIYRPDSTSIDTFATPFVYVPKN